MIKIIPSTNFISVIKNKYLLLDTNVFIDTLLNPHSFFDFLNDLKKQQVTLSTIDMVKMEFLKGAPDEQKYIEKTSLMNSIIDNTIAATPDINENIFTLLKKYRLDGKASSLTDLYLGAYLMKYGKNLFLLTRNTTDFPQNIFEVKSIVNVTYSKGIHTYGLYQYSISISKV